MLTVLVGVELLLKPNDLHVRSSLTEVDTGTDTLLFEA
jgi:hypothetical protein